MRKGKFEKKGKHQRKSFGGKSLALMLACVLLIGGVVGSTVAWLTDESETVTNTFTESDINITLSEEEPVNKTAAMVPGWIINKDPKVTVDADSEDCWLFVKITESTSPDLDAYIAYAIADQYDATENPNGWKIVQQENEAGEIVIGRKVYKDDNTKTFSILGGNSYTDTMGTENDADDYTITWSENQVCVKPSVTEDMMTAISTAKPTLSFQAYAVQLFKTNSNGDRTDTSDEFTVTEALARAADMNSGD